MPLTRREKIIKLLQQKVIVAKHVRPMSHVEIARQAKCSRQYVDEVAREEKQKKHAK